MRIAIREQLAFLVLFAVLVSLAIVSVPVWFYVYPFVVSVESDGLALTASLKAARISSEIELVQTTCGTIATRILIQQALLNYYSGNTSDSNWDNAREDFASALSSGGGNLFQVRVFSRNSTGSTYGLLNVTGSEIPAIELPYENDQGIHPLLSDTADGYPPSLYPNITYDDTGVEDSALPGTNLFTASPLPGVHLSANGGLLLGPLVINGTYAIMSLTIPIRSNNGSGYILGYMTIIASAAALISVQTSLEGLGNTGVVLIIGPENASNTFNSSTPASNATYVPDRRVFGNYDVHFVLPPTTRGDGQADRHEQHNYDSGNYTNSFPLKDYPAALTDFSTRIDTPNNASAALWQTNEEGHAVSVGYARPTTSLVNWTIIIEQAQNEATGPIDTLRSILLGCVFGTAGVILLLIVPCAHLSVMPIRRLKDATEKSMAPPGFEDELEEFGLDDEEGLTSGSTSKKSTAGFSAWVRRTWLSRKLRRRRRRIRKSTDRESARQVFKIPGKVDDRKHYITDELTELTSVFNEMSDELLKQYTSLDEKVSERTRELEISKKAAEAANESKTLFIANISHELKTPLNGIMGMCAVCMEEDDIVRIKQSLKTLYKSGDLLLHLLEDLLSFSKNQIGHQVNLEEREFRLGDIRQQMLSIFDKQVKEKNIEYTVDFVGSEALDLINASPERASLDRRLPALGPSGVGRLRDMGLWGDQHRILQVLINLVSNSLKFTPAGGQVKVRIKCVAEIESSDESRAASLSSKGSQRNSRPRHWLGTSSSHTSNSNSRGGSSSIQQSQMQKGTALSINPMTPMAGVQYHSLERPATPPPSNAKSYLFEFEIEDTGPGIPENMQQRVFEPFVQADPGLSKKFGGTGLGLSICSQLATLMGGSVSLKSTVGVGSTFTVHIPLKYTKDKPSSTASSSLRLALSRPASASSLDIERRRDSLGEARGSEGKTVPPAADMTKQPRLIGLSQPFFAAQPAPQTEAEKLAIIRAKKETTGGKLRVLVADDNKTNVEVVCRMLKLEDVSNVTIARDGQEAYELVKANFERNERFDVIFMDIQMPNLDGLQSTRLIRKMGYSAPIVALTAFSDASNMKNCIESGMDEFLSKPIRRPALKQILQKFATIPEEPETSSLLTRKTTPEKTPSTETPETAEAVTSEKQPVGGHHSNGVASSGNGKDKEASAPL